MDLFDSGEGVALLMIALVVFSAVLIVKVFYLLTLQKTMEQVAPERRAMPSGQVWLELIPIFNIVWQFFNVNNVCKSVQNEFEFRGMSTEDVTSANTLGKTFCILNCCSIVPVIGGLIGIGSLVCWIIFWVKANNIKTQLENYQLHKIQHIQ